MIKLIINTLPPLALPPPHFRHQMPITVHHHLSRCLHAYREIIVDKSTLSVNIVLDMFWIITQNSLLLLQILLLIQTLLHPATTHPEPLKQRTPEITQIHQLHPRPQLQHTNLMRPTQLRQNLPELISTHIKRLRQRRQLRILHPLQLHQHHSLISLQMPAIYHHSSIRNHILSPFFSQRRTTVPLNS